MVWRLFKIIFVCLSLALVSYGQTPNYSNNITTACNWAASHIINTDGSIGNGYPVNKVTPYFGNLAATGFTKCPSTTNMTMTIVLNYVKWYIGKLNATDVWSTGTGGTIYDYNATSSGTTTCFNSPCDADSTDAYAGTFFTLAWNLWQTGDSASRTYLQGQQTALHNILSAMLFTQDTDGLTWAKPSYHIKYTEDALEVYDGLNAAVSLFQAIGDSTDQTTAQNALTSNNTGINSLYQGSGVWYKDKNNGGTFDAPTLTTWSPDAACQLFPAAHGFLTSSDSRLGPTYSSFDADWSSWPQLQQITNGQDNYPWNVDAFGAARSGATSAVNTYINTLQTVYVTPGYTFPSCPSGKTCYWNGEEDGWFIRLNAYMQGLGGGGGGGGGVSSGSLTANNTSCSSSFAGNNDTRSGVNTVDYEPPCVNTSRAPFSAMLYSGWNGKVFANDLLWFSTTYNCTTTNGGIGGWSLSRPQCNSHILTKYSSNDPTYINNQVNDLIGRGYAGAIPLDEGYYYQGTTTIKLEQQAIQSLNTNLNGRCSGGTCPFYWFDQLDGSALKYANGYDGVVPPGTLSITTTTQENNVIAWLKDYFCYMNKFYYGSASYYKINGHPVMQSFVIEAGNTSGAAPSWADTWIQVNNFASNLSVNCPVLSSVYTGAPNNGVPMITFGQGSSAFTHDGLTNNPNAGPVWGAYLWENGVGQGVSQQTTGVTNALSSADTYYTTAKASYASSEWFAAVWAGFDDNLANWSPNYGSCAVGSYCTTSGRISDRACGMTWVNSFKEIGNYFNSTTQMPLIQVVTWSDYDEGTETESGIDNCWSISASLSGTNVSWTLTKSNNTANLATVNKMSIWATVDGTNFTLLADGIAPATTGSVNVNSSVTSLAVGTWTIFVQAVGQNSIQNHTANAGTITIAAPPPSGGGGGTGGGGSTGGGGVGGKGGKPVSFPSQPNNYGSLGVVIGP